MNSPKVRELLLLTQNVPHSSYIVWMIQYKFGMVYVSNPIYYGNDFEKVDVNFLEDYYRCYNALMYASQYDHPGIVKYLIAIGADLELEDSLGNTALIISAANNNYEIIKILVKAGAKHKNNIGKTALTIAASKSECEIVKFLVKFGANPNLQDFDGRSPLSLAVLNRCENIIDFLVQLDQIDVNIQDNDGQTALMLAVEKGYLSIVKILVKISDINVQNRRGDTALMIASRMKRAKIAEVLIEAGANLKNREGETALSLACMNGCPKIVKMLAKFDISDEDVKNNFRIRKSENYRDDAQKYLKNFRLKKMNSPEVRELLSLTQNPPDPSYIVWMIQHKLGMVNTPAEFANYDGDELDGYFDGEDFSDGDGLDYSELISSHLKSSNTLYGGNYYKIVDIDLKDRRGHTALMIAIVDRRYGITKTLIEAGANIDILYQNGKTIPISASCYGHYDTVKIMVDLGLDINIQNSYGSTMLIEATGSDHLEIVKLLLESGADPNIQRKDGGIALIRACNNKNIEIVKILLESNADINIQDSNGCTALTRACVKDQYGIHTGEYQSETAELLIKSGADVNILDVNGCTPLMIVSETGNHKLAKLLIEFGANLDDQNENGRTALMAAAIRGYSEVLNILIEFGANFDCQNDNGDTALILASEHNHPEIVEILIEAGADENIKNKFGMTASTFSTHSVYRNNVGHMFDNLSKNILQNILRGDSPSEGVASSTAWKDLSELIPADMFPQNIEPSSNPEPSSDPEPIRRDLPERPSNPEGTAGAIDDFSNLCKMFGNLLGKAL